MITFELWNLGTGNLRDEFDTIEEALSSIRETIRDHGRGEVADWALGVTDGEKGQRIAEGEALITLALGTPEPGVAASA
jgi:hypothetical protein